MSGPEVSRRAVLRILTPLALTPALVGCTALLRGEDLTEAEKVYSQLMCNCGCNQVLGECNHIGCPNSVPMRAEVDRYLAEGHTAEETVAMFVEKYGPEIRSAPPKSGWFNISAWITPFLALGAGIALVSVYVGRMLRRGDGGRGTVAPDVGDTADAPGAADRATLERLEKELADFTPED